MSGAGVAGGGRHGVRMRGEVSNTELKNVLERERSRAGHGMQTLEFGLCFFLAFGTKLPPR